MLMIGAGLFLYHDRAGVLNGSSPTFSPIAIIRIVPIHAASALRLSKGATSPSGRRLGDVGSCCSAT